MNYKRTILGENIGFTSVVAEKFNTCSICVRFITELSNESAAANSAAVDMLTISNGTFPTLAEMNEQLSELYGAALSSSSAKKGDVQILSISASWLCDRFALDGEDITGRMLAIIRDCIFKPNAENGSFDEENFGFIKKDLIDRIDGELNDKRGYTLTQAVKTAFRGEPAEFPCTGSRETAEALTAKSAFEAYEKFLKESQIEIFYVAPEENPAVSAMFEEAFKAVDRKSRAYTFRSISPLKDAPELVTEEMDVMQAKMAMTFKSDSEDTFALRMVSVILGETPVSKLFANVREKLSLCYYCASRYNMLKNAIIIDSGVEKENIPEATEEIIRQIDDMKNGNITDTETESAVLALENAFAAVGDTPSSYSNWYFDRFIDGEFIEPAEYFDRLKSVTKERLVQAAASLKLDSTYHMLNREAE